MVSASIGSGLPCFPEPKSLEKYGLILVDNSDGHARNPRILQCLSLRSFSSLQEVRPLLFRGSVRALLALTGRGTARGTIANEKAHPSQPPYLILCSFLVGFWEGFRCRFLLAPPKI